MSRPWQTLFMLICLLLPLASAEWEDASKEVYLDVTTENYRGSDVLDIENFFIKVNSLSYEHKSADIVLSDRAGVIYHQGLITPTKDFMQPGKIWLRWDTLRLWNGHPQVKFKVLLWQQLSFLAYNIPSVMNWEDEYDVYMDWKNLGDTDLNVFFEIVAEDGFVTAQKLDKSILFKPQEEKRVYFHIRPERYVTTGPITSARTVLDDLVLELLVRSATSGELLRKVDLGRYSLTPAPTAFVQEIITPQTQFVGKEYEVKVKVRNSGYAQKNTGDYVRDSFMIRLEAPGFTIKNEDFLYTRLDAYTSKEVNFVVKPLSGGVRNLVATFNVDKKPAAALAENVVVKGTKTLLLGDLTHIPREFKIGSSYKLPVKVLNKGDFTEEVVVRVSSPSFSVRSTEFVLKLLPKSEKEVTFDVVAEKTGPTQLLFEVITSSENLRVTQYFKGEGFAADEKVWGVIVQGLEGEPEEKLPEEQPQVKPSIPIEEKQTPIEEKTKPSVAEQQPSEEGKKQPSAPSAKKTASFSMVNVLLLVVGLFIIFILIALIAQKSGKKVSTSISKKKKKKGEDFELE